MTRLGAWVLCRKTKRAGGRLFNEITSRSDGAITYQSLRGFPHIVVHGAHAPAWHSCSQGWNPHPRGRPHAFPQETFSCEQRTLGTVIFPHAQSFSVR